MTEQAAQKRFATEDGGAGGLDPAQGFGRFTQRARNVVVTAQNEAARAGNAEIGTAHLVLGLLADPTATAARALAAQDVPAERVGAAARAALELAFGEARRLGRDHVGTGHLLLALLAQEDGAGPLTSAGLTSAATERAGRG